MSTRNAWGTKADKLLADGEWRRFDEIVGLVAGLIPPGQALRRAGRQRSSETDDYRAINSGRRSILARMAADRVRSGTWEKRGEERPPPTVRPDRSGFAF